MNAQDVVQLYGLFEDHAVHIWIDGGWGVDALLGEQTRPHDDLDIAIQTKDVGRMRELLEIRGYKDKGEENARPWNFVLIDEAGRQLDVHAIDLDPEGNGVLGPVTNDSVYPAASLTGVGKILGQSVRCISAEWLVRFHSGYKLDENDIKDVRALCERFAIEQLPEHKNWSPEI